MEQQQEGWPGGRAAGLTSVMKVFLAPSETERRMVVSHKELERIHESASALPHVSVTNPIARRRRTRRYVTITVIHTAGGADRYKRNNCDLGRDMDPTACRLPQTSPEFKGFHKS